MTIHLKAPCDMSAAERLAVIADLLATSLVRLADRHALGPQAWPQESPESSQKGLEVRAHTSVTVSTG